MAYTVGTTCVPHPRVVQGGDSTQSSECPYTVPHVHLRKGEHIWRLRQSPHAQKPRQHLCNGEDTRGGDQLHPWRTDSIYGTNQS